MQPKHRKIIDELQNLQYVLSNGFRTAFGCIIICFVLNREGGVSNHFRATLAGCIRSGAKTFIKDEVLAEMGRGRVKGAVTTGSSQPFQMRGR